MNLATFVHAFGHPSTSLAHRPLSKRDVVVGKQVCNKIFVYPAALESFAQFTGVSSVTVTEHSADLLHILDRAFLCLLPSLSQESRGDDSGLPATILFGKSLRFMTQASDFAFVPELTYSALFENGTHFEVTQNGQKGRVGPVSELGGFAGRFTALCVEVFSDFQRQTAQQQQRAGIQAVAEATAAFAAQAAQASAGIDEEPQPAQKRRRSTGCTAPGTDPSPSKLTGVGLERRLSNVRASLNKAISGLSTADCPASKAGKFSSKWQCLAHTWSLHM
jgi:hypothetical protein